jgi:translation elongation factor EF-1beta
LLEQKKKEMEDAKKKTGGKPGVIAKSLVVFECKPWEKETDLDAMAENVLKIEMDGLVWKTEYKKEPIAYGVHKLVIGCVIEDEKVSTDDLQEKIEALEEYVQSVDIQSFSKI